MTLGSRPSSPSARTSCARPLKSWRPAGCLVFEGVGAQRPTMAEDDGLPRPPVVVIDLSAVLHGDGCHVTFPSLGLTELVAPVRSGRLWRRSCRSRYRVKRGSQSADRRVNLVAQPVPLGEPTWLI